MEEGRKNKEVFDIFNEPDVAKFIEAGRFRCAGQVQNDRRWGPKEAQYVGNLSCY